MASLSGVSSSNTVSSLMNSANMISGLASGLDTESMIENLVKGYQNKIESLNKQVAKTEWKQDAYRSIISKLVGFNNKYTSYTSSSNLSSSSFFSSSVKVDALGAFASKVSASGRTSSEISLDKVTQLATAARYRTRSNLASGETGMISGTSVDLSSEAEKNIELSNLSGSLTLTYGSKTLSVNFSESTTAKDMSDIRTKLEKDGKSATDAEVLAGYINQKLADEKIVFYSGTSESADQRIKATANADGRIVFEELGTAKNGLYISGASGNIAKQLGLNEDDLEDAKEKKPTVINANTIKGTDGEKGLTRKLNSIEYLAEKSQAASDKGSKLSMSISLDGNTKQIDLPEVTVVKMGGIFADQYFLNGKQVGSGELADKYTQAVSDELKKAFGDKVTVENKGGARLQLDFKVKNEGSDLVINTSVGEALGIGNTATSYLDTGKTLGELLKNEDGTSKMDDADFLKNLKEAYEKDSKGNFKLDKDGNKILAKDSKGDQMYEFEINGTVVGSFSKNSKLSDVLTAINSNKEAGVQASYSQTTQNFTFTAKETGAESEIKMGKGLAEAVFGTTEVEDRGGSSFAEAYGVKGLQDGVKVKFTFEVPGTNNSTTFKISKETSMDDVADKLNDAFQQLYSFEYNKYSGQIEARSISDGSRVDFAIKDWDNDPVKFDKSQAPSIDYTPGQDAKFTVTVNGETKNMTRSSNTVNIDGLSITMKDTFDGFKSADGKEDAVTSAGRPANAVTFQSRSDSDKIVETIKGMIEEYNTVMSEIKSAYSTLPYQKSNGSFSNYEPLTEDERAGMSESAIERYEEKAKQGLLFGDRNLSNLYNKMRNVFAGANEADLRAMGITMSYSITDGAEAITLDESKLRDMLESDPDRVSDVFTKETGVMQTMKSTLDTYAKTTGEPKGILIQQAGSPLSSLSLMNNTWQKEIDKLNSQVEKWQDKLTSQVEKYTSQFTRLEQLIQQMNSQSSTLAGLMGGG